MVNFQPNIKGYHTYKCLLLISMLFITDLIVSALAVKRVILIGPLMEPGGILIFPLTYFLSDVITEVYGYKIARQILWFGFFCQFIFSLLIVGIMHLPAATFWHDQKSFETVFGHLFFYCLTTTLGTLCGGFLNIYIVSKFKILLQGKYFWIRSLLSSSVGELIFSLIALTPIFLHSVGVKNALWIALSAYLFKLSYGIIAVIPSSILVKILKKIENVDVYDFDTNFNPLKLEVN